MSPSIHTCFLTRCWRLLRFALWTLKMLWVCRVHYPFLTQEKRDERSCRLARQGLAILRVCLSVTGNPSEHIRHTLFVANHVSWLDVLVLLACYPMGFVAKKEIRSWFMIGKAAEFAGTIFVDRSQRGDTDAINRAMADSLRLGRNAVFFPEAGTSADGLHLKPFKAALFESAILSASAIQPVAMRFYDGNGCRTTRPAYTDKVTLFGCVCNILSLRETEVRLEFLPSISAEEVVASERYALKERIEAQIKAVVEADIDGCAKNHD
ncbi:MAG: lysophospholipid acyltransferase family protein [Neisseria sp.]|nr:lysophospholipid acyltransferase family protein [Neisseria sp.]